MLNFSQTEGGIQLAFSWRVWLAIANATRGHPPPLRCIDVAPLAPSAGEIYEPVRHVRNDFTPAALVKG
jgi:hypothetical protein